MKIAWRVVVVASVLALPAAAAASERFVSNPKAATDCQSALLTATTSFAQKKTKQLDKCAAAAFRCIQTVAPNDNAVVDPIEACLEKAFTLCDKATTVITAEEQKLVDAVTKGCAGLDSTEVLRADAVGFEVIAPDCLDVAGVTLSDTASVVDCVLQQHECAVEQLYLMEHPRAGELFDLVGADLGPDSCLDDLGGPGVGVEDLKLGRAIAKCEQDVTKVGAGFVATKLKGVGKCLGALFDCVQLAPNDGGKCLAKAQKTCDGAFGTVAKGALKVEPAVGESCGSIPFVELTADTGVFYDSLVENDLCTPYGVGGILTTAEHYATCLYRQHECVTEDIMKFTVPRAAELLALIDRPFPASFFCTPPEGF